MDSRTKRPSASNRLAPGMIVAAAALTLAGGGCLERGLKPVNPCTRSSVGQSIQVTNVDKVDLLFMIDNSNSMAEEQANLIDELPRLVRVLASGDSDEDGTQDFNPVSSLHVGVVTSDMGSGPFTVSSCAAGLGDDGVLQTTGMGDGCSASYPSGIFEFNAATDNSSTFASTVGCVANLGTGGCGFEQQLESPLKALTPSVAQSWTREGYIPPLFSNTSGVANTTVGHGDNANSGFVRSDSALAVVLVTDEEDCSVINYDLFNPESTAFTAPLNLRCNTFGDPAFGAVHPVSRYVDGFLGLRADPGLLIFSAITGIPTSAESLAQAGDYSGILALTEMIPTPDAANTNLNPSCETGAGKAYPPVRIVSVAAGLAAAGASVSISSICSESFQPAIDGIIAKIAEALKGACLPRALNRNSEGLVDCEVYELLPAPADGVISNCADLPGRTAVESDDPTRQRCLVTQVANNDAGTGWYYDDASAEVLSTCSSYESAQRIAFTSSTALSPTGTQLRLECLQTISTGVTTSDTICDSTNVEDVNGCEIGMFCELDADNCGSGTSLPNGAGAALSCDPVELLCAVPCDSDADCTEAGQLGYVCDTRTNAVAAGTTDVDNPDAIRNICVNPTCN